MQYQHKDRESSEINPYMYGQSIGKHSVPSKTCKRLRLKLDNKKPDMFLQYPTKQTNTGGCSQSIHPQGPAKLANESS